MMQRRKFLTSSAIGATGLLSVLGSAGCAKKPEVAVASKEGTEQMLVGEIVSLLLEKKAQAKVNRLLSFGLSSSINQAMGTGDIDVYPEYAHVAYRSYFKVDEPIDPAMSLEKLQKEFRSNKRAEFLAPLGFENNYTAIIMADHPRFASIQSLTEAASDESGWRLGFFREFSQGGDGYNFFKSTYRFTESAAPQVNSFEALFRALEERQLEILIACSTDARLKNPKFKALTDDKNIFARNWASLVVRQEMLDKNPSVLPLLNSLSGKISSQTMQDLNGRVDLDKRPIAEVAADWVAKSGLA
jgi:glycine betaine/choline ABC-type transport system substrate-binding protein